LATEVLYGGSFAFTKSVTGTIDPLTLLGWRFVVALAALLVLLATRLIRLRITRATIRPLLLLAVFQPVLYYVAETFGVMRTTASESGLIVAAIPVVIIVTAALILKSRPSGWQVAGIAVTLAGVVTTVVAGGFTARFDLAGYGLLLAAVVSFSLYAAFAERYAHAVSDVDKTFTMVLLGAVVFGTAAVIEHGADGTLGTLVRLPVDRPDFALAVAYLALGSTVGAFFLQNVAIGALGSTRFSTFIGVTTVTTLVTGAIVLRETLSAAQFLGGAAILAGVSVANRRAATTACP
jgi:drug/metabolite transporter (DMT)-like permease